MVICAAFLEWLKSGSATVSGELLVLMETVAIYARAALAPHLTREADTLMEFLTGILLAPLAIMAIVNSLTLFLAPKILNAAVLLRLFSLAVTVEFLSILVMLEERPTITSLAGLLQPRLFAWLAHCALLIAVMGLVVAPSAPIDGVLGLGIAMMCVLSAADYIRSAESRMKAE